MFDKRLKQFSFLNGLFTKNIAEYFVEVALKDALRKKAKATQCLVGRFEGFYAFKKKARKMGERFRFFKSFARNSGLFVFRHE